jgi:acylglycerol lipase
MPMVPVRPDEILGTAWSQPTDAADGFTLVEREFTSCRGTPLYGKHLLVAKARPSRGSVLCTFGAGDHSNSPYHGGQMITLARMGYDVHAFDYESLGRSAPTHASGEPRFFIPDFQNLADDCVAFAVSEIARYGRPGCRLFLFGESLGGAVALLASQLLPVSGMVLLAPMCKLGNGMTFHPCLEFALSCLARCLPRRHLPMGKPGVKKHAPDPTPPPGYSDKSMWAQQDLDPLRVQQFPPRLGTALSILNTTKRIQRSMESFRTPMYLLGGTEDGACAPSAVRELHKRAGARDKAIKQYEGYGHCILAEEPARASLVEADIKAWLLARSVGGATAWRQAAVPAPRRPWRQVLLALSLLMVLAGCAYFWRGRLAAVVAAFGFVFGGQKIEL